MMLSKMKEFYRVNSFQSFSNLNWEGLSEPLNMKNPRSSNGFWHSILIEMFSNLCCSNVKLQDKPCLTTGSFQA